MACTSSITIIPQSCSWIHFIVSSASHDRRCVCVIMLKVVISTPQPIGLSLASEVNLQMVESSAVDHILNCCFHCSTDTPLLQSTTRDKKKLDLLKHSRISKYSQNSRFAACSPFGRSLAPGLDHILKRTTLTLSIFRFFEFSIFPIFFRYFDFL